MSLSVVAAIVLLHLMRMTPSPAAVPQAEPTLRVIAIGGLLVALGCGVVGAVLLAVRMAHSSAADPGPRPNWDMPWEGRRQRGRHHLERLPT